MEITGIIRKFVASKTRFGRSKFKKFTQFNIKIVKMGEGF